MAGVVATDQFGDQPAVGVPAPLGFRPTASDLCHPNFVAVPCAVGGVALEGTRLGVFVDSGGGF